MELANAVHPDSCAACGRVGTLSRLEYDPRFLRCSGCRSLFDPDPAGPSHDPVDVFSVEFDYGGERVDSAGYRARGMAAPQAARLAIRGPMRRAVAVGIGAGCLVIGVVIIAYAFLVGMSGSVLLVFAGLPALFVLGAWSVLLSVSSARVVTFSPAEVALGSEPLPLPSWRKRIPLHAAYGIRCKHREVEMRHDVAHFFGPCIRLADGQEFDIPYWPRAAGQGIYLARELDELLQLFKKRCGSL